MVFLEDCRVVDGTIRDRGQWRKDSDGDTIRFIEVHAPCNCHPPIYDIKVIMKMVGV